MLIARKTQYFAQIINRVFIFREAKMQDYAFDNYDYHSNPSTAYASRRKATGAIPDETTFPIPLTLQTMESLAPALAAPASPL